MKTKPFTLLLAFTFLFLFSSTSLVAGDEFQDAKEAYKKKDYEMAYKLFLPLAEQGNAEAQNKLSFLYSVGKGAPHDTAEALKWNRLSAEQGYISAQIDLAVNYTVGIYVPVDHKKAEKWWRLAAEQGDAMAQYNLGEVYRNGRGVSKDRKEAFKWYRLSAEQGDARAQLFMGVNYFAKHEAQSYKEAVKWFRLSAEQESARAQFLLGYMYHNGYGVLQDYALAHMWLNLAGFNGDQDAENERGFVEKKMSSSQIEKAQEMAKNWKPKTN
jgi:uncharacterized protein